MTMTMTLNPIRKMEHCPVKPLMAWFLLLLMTAPASVFTADDVTAVFHQRIRRQGNDFSGLEKIPGQNTYLIVDDSCHILAAALEEREVLLKRRIRLRGLNDCEAVVFLEGSESVGWRVGVTEERRGKIALMTIAPETREIDCRKECERFAVDDMRVYGNANRGLEAMAVAEDGTLFIGKEEQPRMIYRVRPDAGSFEITVPWDAEAVLPADSDIAGLDFFEGYLWILDERLNRIYAVKPESGETVRTWQLPKPGWFRAYEGIVVSRLESGTIQVVIAAERSWIYVFHLQEG